MAPPDPVARARAKARSAPYAGAEVTEVASSPEDVQPKAMPKSIGAAAHRGSSHATSPHYPAYQRE